jgi:hypothetical protein
MNTASLCDPYMWENPLIIFKTQFFYSTNMTCLSEIVNQIVLVVLIMAAAAYALWRSSKMYLPLVAVGLFGLLVIYPSVSSIVKIRKEYEPFIPGVDVIGQNTFAPGTGYDRTMPTSRNPFMNVLVDEIKYNPTRPAAGSVMDPEIQITMDDYFRTEFNRDPTDVFGRNQSQRQFITMPSTSIPNDVDSYRNWLYKIPGKTCKEGGPCIPGTDGAAMPWLNVDSVNT